MKPLHCSGRWLLFGAVPFLAPALALPGPAPSAIKLPVHWARSSISSSNDGTSLLRADIVHDQVFFDWETLEPAIQIGIGTPPQDFYLMFDTGSSVTWFPSTECTQADGCISDRRNYVAVDAPFNGEYVSLTADGQYLHDVVHLGSVSLLDQPLAQVSRQTGTFAQQQADNDLTIDGILGAGFGESDRTIPIALYDAKLVPEPCFSVYMGKAGSDMGSVVFGGVHDNKALNVTSVLDGSDKWYAHSTEMGLIDGQSEETLFTFDAADSMLVDTGTSTSRLLKDEVDTLANKLFGSDATAGDAIYHIKNCSKYLSASWTIVLAFPHAAGDSSFSLEFTPTDVLLQEPSTDVCVFGFGISSERVLGNTVLQRYIATFNFADYTVGFTLR